MRVGQYNFTMATNRENAHFQLEISGQLTIENPKVTRKILFSDIAEDFLNEINAPLTAGQSTTPLYTVEDLVFHLSKI